MAITSLWAIQGRIKSLIDYIENPLKTMEQNKELKDLYHVFEYTTQDRKTNAKQYVSGINCLPEIAMQQMIITKKQFGKTDKRIAYHGIQSFKPNEVTPDLAHSIGKQFAEIMWGDKHQVVVTTHLDKDHIHNHFCVNSVSFLDGKKYNYSKSERARMVALSDYLCKENGLSVVVPKGSKTPPRNIYLAEKNGETTQYTLMHRAISEALQNAYTPQQFETFLKDYGYEVDFMGRYPGIKLPNKPYFTRFTTIDKKFTTEFLKERMRYNAGIQRKYKAHPPPLIPFGIKQEWKQKKATGLKVLYLYYSYQLGILPKNTSYKPVHPSLLEDIKKLDTFSKQAELICDNNIQTLPQLEGYMVRTKLEIDILYRQKKNLENAVRRANEPTKVKIREQKAELTSEIKKWKEVYKLCEGIKERSEKVNEIAEIVANQQEKSKSREQHSR